MATVAPEFEGQGIGTCLLRWAEEREREQGRECHRQWIAGSNERARELLVTAGYTRVRSYWRMVRELGDADAVAGGGIPPSDIRLRPLRLDRDAVAVHALDATSFAAAPDYNPHTLQEFQEEHLGAHDLDPSLSLVAEHGETIVGFLLARRWNDESAGYVDILAVHPDHQDQGLGTALLQTAFAGFAAAGLREAQLGVASDNPRARGLYERVGMTPRFRFDTYERPITQPSPQSAH
jgi:mycothiol synthase